MQHFVESDRKPHTPIPDFDSHSKFLALLVVIAHPFLAIFSLKVAGFITTIIREFAVGLGVVYSSDYTASDPKFSAFAGSNTIYPTVFALILVIIALHAGIFRAFRINKFWPNFLVSLILLLISLAIFAGGNIGGLFV